VGEAAPSRKATMHPALTLGAGTRHDIAKRPEKIE
jgi:hypothetical protein